MELNNETKARTANKVLPKAGLNGFNWAFVQGSTFVLQLNFSTKNPRLRQYPKRYLQTKQSIVNRIKKIIFILPLLFGVSINSIAQEITISTDRPDQSDGVSTVPIGKFQIEEGVTLAKNTAINNLMMRYGITHSTEIRLLLDTGKEFENYGVQPITLSIKQRIIEQHRFIPAISFVGYLSYGQIATKDFQNKEWPFQVKLAFENELTDRFFLGYNIGASDKFKNLDLSAGVGYTITNKISSFIEYFSTISKIGNEHNADLGVMYLITPRFQVDLAFGRSIFAEDPRFIITFGTSYLFN